MLRIELNVLGERIAVEADQPPERVRLDEVLPLLYEIDNRAIDLAVRKVEADGMHISCKKGCSVCCRSQPVPITPPEAFALTRLLSTMPDERRQRIVQRFSANTERLREADLLGVLRREKPIASREEAREVAQRYFALRLVCPFLEDDACGIYADRPFVCRQYLVTSPAELCADPFNNPVEPVPVPLRPATAVLAATEKLLGQEQHSLPLTLAMEYVKDRSETLAQTFPAEETYRECIIRLAE
jgi:Fe-S-cluster containining protein